MEMLRFANNLTKVMYILGEIKIYDMVQSMGIQVEKRDITMADDQQDTPQTGDSFSAGRDVNILKGNVTAEIISQGSETSITVNKHGSDVSELAQFFESVFASIEARSPDPNIDKEELVSTVTKIHDEADQKEPNGRKISRWLAYLGQMAPDIAQVVATGLANPIAGAALGVSKIANKYLEEQSSG